MEAKDKNTIQQQILAKYPGTIPEMDIDWDMMEISFKAGIREVVEWEHKTFSKSITLNQMRATNTYQAKLKDWNIKEE